MSKVPCLDFTERKRKEKKETKVPIDTKALDLIHPSLTFLFGFMVCLPIDTKALGSIHPSIIFRLHLWFLFLVTS
jgi:hypothetical protein